MAYNPYNDVSEILKYKNSYNSAKATGGDYNSQAEAAKQYYQNLRNNNLGDLADELSKADAATATDILKRYSPDELGNTVGSMTSQFENLLKPSYQDTGGQATQNATAMSDYLNRLSAPSPVQSQSNTQALANLQALMDMVGQNNQDINAKGNDLWAQMKQFGIDQTGRYEDLYDYTKNTDFLKTPEGKSIMDNYKYLGGQAAGNATANAAGSNGGNIDSYSAANANRQQLAYTNAGTMAALGQKNANVGNMLATLQSLGVDMGGLIDDQNTFLQNGQNYNVNMANQYTAGQNNVAGQMQAQRDAQNNLVSNGLNYLLGINANDTARYQSGLNTAGNIATGAMNAAANVNANKTALEQTKLSTEAQKYVTDVTSALERYSVDKNAETQKAVQDSINKTQIDLQNLVNAGRMSEMEYEKAIAMIQAEAQKYGYDAGITEAGIKAQADNTASTSGQNEGGDLYDVMYAFESLVKQIGGKNNGKSTAWAEEQAWLELERDYAGDKYMLDVIKSARKLYDEEKKNTGSTGNTLEDKWGVKTTN